MKRPEEYTADEKTMLNALSIKHNIVGHPIYDDTVAAKEKAKRRAKAKAARKARKRR